MWKIFANYFLKRHISQLETNIYVDEQIWN